MADVAWAGGSRRVHLGSPEQRFHATRRISKPGKSEDIFPRLQKHVYTYQAAVPNHPECQKYSKPLSSLAVCLRAAFADWAN